MEYAGRIRRQTNHLPSGFVSDRDLGSVDNCTRGIADRAHNAARTYRRLGK